MNLVGILSAHVQRCCLFVASCLILSTIGLKAEPITEQQAHAIGVDAYLYFYPLVTIDLTRKQLTDVETGTVQHSNLARRRECQSSSFDVGDNEYEMLLRKTHA